MDLLRKIALVSELLDRIRANNVWAGPVHLQKSMFFLQEMRGVPLDFEFVLYRYGPYSFELQDEIEYIRGSGFLKWFFHDSPGYATGLETTEASRNIRDKLPKLMDKYEDDLAFVSENIGPMRSMQLERVSTSFYYMVKGLEGDEDIAREVCKVKPHIDYSDAAEAVQQVRQFAEQSGWRRMDSVTWPIEPHTLAKHDLLRRYLGDWFPIMYKRNKRIIYLDAFAGPGVYAGGEPGSPLIALETLITHKSFPKMSETEFGFVFIEKDKSKCQRLEQEIETFWLKQGIDKPSNIEIDVINDEFMNIAQDVLNKIEPKGATLAPAFAFIDPFGWSDIRFDLMMQIVSFDKWEILFTFMVEHISRFLNKPNTQKSLQGFFGTDKYRDFVSLSGDKRIESLRDLFVDQLREKGSFSHVTPFEMVSNRGKTECFLIHGTRHIKGLQVMKDAMWKLDPTGNYQFEARWKGQEVLFGPNYIKDLKKEFIEEFKGREVSISEIENYVLTDTLYTKNHVVPTLKEMEKEIENKGIILATNRQRKRTYPSGTKITFF